MFSVVVPGRPCLTDIVAVDAQADGQATKFAFSFPLSPPFTDLVVFLLPGTVLPPNTGAAIYIQTPDPSSGSPTDFRFIGALANEKPSGIFPVQTPSQSSNGAPTSEAEQEDEMLDEGAGAGGSNAIVTLGISIEPVQNIAPQLTALENENPGSQSTALVRVSPGQAQQKQISTKVLAQRIIGSAFNFLASFAESDPTNKGHEVVPLKSFRDWWTKFERRIDMDPTFLERADPNAT